MYSQTNDRQVMNYKLYDSPPSGNCYKVRLLLTQLEIPFDRINVNILQGATRVPEFLQKNPAGKVPVLEIQPDVYLSESGAILAYLAEGTEYFPRDNRLLQTRVLQWLFFEQYSLSPNLSRPRFFISVAKQQDKFAHLIDHWRNLGYQALDVMEQHLEKYAFFVNDSYTIADIALYSYTHVASEGGYDMSKYPAIQAWCDRVKSQPKYIGIKE
ncbi:MAG: glutathione S-transferase family protein [Cyanomargarita calcarea GSE-NOS-MK-12-04C]|jgi:glutathione S-transferase|uniref:Glutathione S-transferase family protein n=1 Tax=Cyanomargarita calcarea GSE-NOS-MK-12-04C TaxID=2839659 RepID=A0A951QQP4_9CYAN|nr:glutathione S-transferase family protein [Cyanomargarita calcarea GSE-NOS-MK-12-04C]